MKIFIVFLFLILIILALGGLFFVLFMIFVPYLKKKNIEVSNPLFSEFDMVHYDPTIILPDADNTKRAVILCSSDKIIEHKRIDYEGVKDCSLFNSLYDGEYDCSWGCCGFGNCVRACPKNAIIIKNGTAVVSGSCNGCGKCIKSCPLHLIKLISVKKDDCVLCGCTNDCDVNCSKKGKSSVLNNEESKDFQFWKKCYKIINRK